MGWLRGRSSRRLRHGYRVARSPGDAVCQRAPPAYRACLQKHLSAPETRSDGTAVPKKWATNCCVNTL
ncbi:hypothetical protein G155_00258 [Mycobacterium sp. VKM Ac-1817D]|nr:hypothetical protein G155_00258 [Mycobacterium sp. VKM Ac-1817D]